MKDKNYLEKCFIRKQFAYALSCNFLFLWLEKKLRDDG